MAGGLGSGWREVGGEWVGCMQGLGKVVALRHGCVLQSVHFTCAAISHLNEPATSPGDTGQCLGTSVVVTNGSAAGIEWVEARDAAQHPTVPRMAPFPTHRFIRPKCQWYQCDPCPSTGLLCIWEWDG